MISMTTTIIVISMISKISMIGKIIMISKVIMMSKISMISKIILTNDGKSNVSLLQHRHIVSPVPDCCC